MDKSERSGVGLFSPQGRLLLATLLIFQAVAIPAWAKDPNLAACGAGATCAGHGTELNAGDSVVISQTHTPLANLSGAGDVSGTAVLSIVNNTGTKYFVPWNTPTEWDAFLKAIQAQRQLNGLAPNPVNTPLGMTATGYGITVGNACGGTATLQCPNGNRQSATFYPGQRFEGLANGLDPQIWGAIGDIDYGYASQILGDSTMTFWVAAACNAQGQWVVTNGDGSCTAVDGACGGPPYTTSEIQKQQQNPNSVSGLCAQTSVFGSWLQGGPSTATSSTGPWQWTCNGTPSKNIATCNYNVTAGSCGAADGLFTRGAPTANLCPSGATASSVTDNTASTGFFNWSCDTASTHADCSAPAHAGCNTALNGNGGTTAPLAPLCTYGTPEGVALSASCAVTLDPTAAIPTYGLDIWNCNATAWNWECTIPADTINPWYNMVDPCVYFDTSKPGPGKCGDAAGDGITSSQAAPTSNLCAGQGVFPPSTLVSASLQTSGDWWIWQCQGPNNGTTTNCTSAPGMGICGPGNNGSYDTAPSGNLLCSAGSAEPNPAVANQSDTLWTWSCVGTSGTANCTANISSGNHCGTLANTQAATCPAASATGLCISGDTLTGSITQSGNTCSWTCQDTNGSQQCQSTITTNGAACGTASATVTTNAAYPSPGPQSGLCDQGTSSPINAINVSGTMEWAWNCAGNSTSVGCWAYDTDSAPGACGQAVTALGVPAAPDSNLCAMVGNIMQGYPSPVPVTSNGGLCPCSWTCYGYGSDADQNASCSVGRCDACPTSNRVSSSYSNISVSGTYNGCNVTGTASWSGSDGYFQLANSDTTVSGSSPFSFTSSQIVDKPAGQSPTDPSGYQYCTPCSQGPVSASGNVTVTITSSTGAAGCDTLVGNSYPFSSVTFATH